MTAHDRPKTLKLGQDALRYNVDSQLLTTSDSDTHRRLFSGLAVWPVGDDARTIPVKLLPLCRRYAAAVGRQARALGLLRVLEYSSDTRVVYFYY